MENRLKALLIGGILIVLSLIGCSKDVGKNLENAVPQYTYVNWDRGFQKGALSEGSQMYSIDYWELSHNPLEDYSYSRVEDIRYSG